MNVCTSFAQISVLH